MNEAPNLSYIKELSAGSEEFEEKIIGLLKREFPEEKNEFLNNYNSSVFKAAAENVHKLKHKIGMLGFEDGYETTIAFEEGLLKGEYSLFSKFMLILDSIDEFLKNL
ncbi:Hpt domain-containing protein [Aquimarina sp. 433]